MYRFTSAQARALGYDWRLLSYHAAHGRFIRLQRGLYRMRDYPSFPREEVMAAWLAAGKDTAVVSHESALDMLDLPDVVPDAVHLLVPRKRRYLPSRPGVIVHTTTHQLSPGDVMTKNGIRLTEPTRTILDAAETGDRLRTDYHGDQAGQDTGLDRRYEVAAGGASARPRIADLVERALQEE